MPWHGNSEFPHPTQFRPMDRPGLKAWRRRVDELRSEGAISPATHDVAYALSGHLNYETGRCDPSHARIAEVARCARRTVIDALQALRRLGMIDWTRRIVRLGKRGAQQITNAFRLIREAANAGNFPVCKPCTPTNPKKILSSDGGRQPPRQHDPEAAEALRKMREAREAAIGAPRTTLPSIASGLGAAILAARKRIIG